MNQRAVVIGGGIVGCSTALALARKGWSVLVVEQLRGSGGGQRLVRLRLSDVTTRAPRAVGLRLKVGLYGKIGQSMLDCQRPVRRITMLVCCFC